MTMHLVPFFIRAGISKEVISDYISRFENYFYENKQQLEALAVADFNLEGRTYDDVMAVNIYIRRLWKDLMHVPLEAIKSQQLINALFDAIVLQYVWWRYEGDINIDYLENLYQRVNDTRIEESAFKAGMVGNVNFVKWAIKKDFSREIAGEIVSYLSPLEPHILFAEEFVQREVSRTHDPKRIEIIRNFPGNRREALTLLIQHCQSELLE